MCVKAKINGSGQKVCNALFLATEITEFIEKKTKISVA
jgi:hypothetical protein